MYFLLISLILFRILYELITETRAWGQCENTNQSELYNLIRSEDFSFFSYNIPIGVDELD